MVEDILDSDHLALSYSHCAVSSLVEKLRRSLPNLARSSAAAQGPEPVKNSRSCESNLQVPNGSPRHQNQSAREYIIINMYANMSFFLFESISMHKEQTIQSC